MKSNLNFNASSNRGNTLHDLRFETNNHLITRYQSHKAQLDEESPSKSPFLGLNFSYVQDPSSETEKRNGTLKSNILIH